LWDTLGECDIETATHTDSEVSRRFPAAIGIRMLQRLLKTFLVQQAKGLLHHV
jgi:hypothetical protein